MSGKAITLIVGLVLIALAIVWFATPLDDVVLTRLRPPPPPATATERSLAPQTQSTLDLLKIALDAANAVIGLIGLAMAIRSARTRKEP